MIKYFILVLAVIQPSFARINTNEPVELPHDRICYTNQDCPQGTFVYSCVKTWGQKRGYEDKMGKCVTGVVPVVKDPEELREIIASASTVSNVIVCDGGTLHVSCLSGKKLSISSAKYGRSADSSVCPHSDVSNTSCSSANSDPTVKTACDGKSTCKIDVNSEVYGGDPCPGTHKYISVTYTCQD